MKAILLISKGYLKNTDRVMLENLKTQAKR